MKDFIDQIISFQISFLKTCFLITHQVLQDRRVCRGVREVWEHLQHLRGVHRQQWEGRQGHHHYWQQQGEGGQTHSPPDVSSEKYIILLQYLCGFSEKWYFCFRLSDFFMNSTIRWRQTAARVRRARSKVTTRWVRGTASWGRMRLEGSPSSRQVRMWTYSRHTKVVDAWERDF